MKTVKIEESLYSMGANNPRSTAKMIVLYVFLFLIVEIPGNLLLLSMISYEKYGMDSQKRTVTNQLLSSICVSFMIQNIIVVPILLLHRIHHPFLITECKKKKPQIPRPKFLLLSHHSKLFKLSLNSFPKSFSS